MISWWRTGRGGAVVLVTVALLTGLLAVRVLVPAGGATSTAGGLTVSVAYAEDKEIETPDPAAFPVPWAGAPNTTFLGGTVPGQAACGTLTACYDAGAIRLDNPGAAPIVVSSVSVDDHSSLSGGKVFNNLWGSFTVAPGQSVILTENPPGNNPGSDNFDTSSYPPSCTPISVAPTVTVTIGGVPTTLVDSTHVLDSGGTDAGSCSPKRNESIQWRAIGAAGSDDATLTLGPVTLSAVDGTAATETATLLDGSGSGIPNATVDFTVTSGPDAGTTGTGLTNATGQTTFAYSGAQGEDLVVASVTTVGILSSSPSRILWTDRSASGWTGSDIGVPSPAGSQSFQSSTGTWTVSGGGTGVGGTTDQFHFVRQTEPSNGGVAARVVSLGGSASARVGVMLRSSTDPGSPFYSALVTAASGIEVVDRTTAGGATTTVVDSATTIPAYLWITQTGTSLTTYSSPDGFTWTPLAGSQANFSLGGAALGGLAVTSGLPGTLETAALDTVALSASPPAPLPAEACPSPFNCADIGNPTPAGSQSYDPNTGTWTIDGGGSDISGTSDQFRFVSRPMTGDGAVTARVVTQTNSGSQAKAGVMVRATADPGSPEYSVVVSPGAGIKVQVRPTQGGITTKLANPVGTVPAYLEITRAGSTFTAFTSPDGSTWTVIPGSATTLALPSMVLAGLAVTSHNSGALGTATMDSVSPGASSTPATTTTTSTSSTTTTTAPPSSCPSPFSCADIGSPTPAGGQSYDPTTGTWTIRAGGADIFGTSDQFRFISEPVTGDGTVTARVVSQTRSSTNTKAGVMLRATTDPGSPEYSVVVTSGAGIKVQVRSKQGGGTTTLANPSGTAPAYLKVTRSGSAFTASTSPDGVNWTVIPGSSFTASLPGALLGGMAVTSHNAAELGTATMDAVAVG
jgi:hypothetical protein